MSFINENHPSFDFAHCYVLLVVRFSYFFVAVEHGHKFNDNEETPMRNSNCNKLQETNT